MAETWIDVRDALVELLKLANTMAGTQVRLGRRIPIENPFSVSLNTEDVMPMAIVSLERFSFEAQDETGRRAEYTRRCTFQVDCYVQQDYAAAQAQNITTDELINKQLDEFASQVVTAVNFYNRFRSDAMSIPEPLRLRGNVEIWPGDGTKYEFPGDEGTVVGVMSVMIIARYELDRTYEDVDDLTTLLSTISTESKDVEIDVTFT